MHIREPHLNANARVRAGHDVHAPIRNSRFTIEKHAKVLKVNQGLSQLTKKVAEKLQWRIQLQDQTVHHHKIADSADRNTGGGRARATEHHGGAQRHGGAHRKDHRLSTVEKIAHHLT